MEILLTLDETSRFLKIKPKTLYTWAYRGQIPVQKVGGALRFRESELTQWLASQSRPVNDDPDY
jgi:excisionase family DNA binding protein